MKSTHNPLLYPFNTPDQTVPFNEIEPEHFEPAIRQKIKAAKSVLKTILKNSEPPTFKNTLVPIEQLQDEINLIGQILFNLNSASTNPTIQAVTHKVSPLLTRFFSKIMLNHRLYQRVKTIFENRENEPLSKEALRLLHITYTTMKRNGASLSFLKKLRLTRIQMQLSRLTLIFNDCVLDETNNFELHIVDPHQLSGLPPDILESAADTAKSKGKAGWIFTLHFPSYVPFMKYADNRELREKIYRAYTSRGNRRNKNDNKKNILKIINLRLKQAQLLGYSNYAEYVLEERMAKNTGKVNELVSQLLDASMPFAHQEMEELKQFAVKSGFTHEMMLWDFAYFSEKLKTEQYGFDETMVKPYFQLEKVVEGTFDIATRLYGLTFKQVNNIPVYHHDVNTYEVYDENGNYLSVLYTDFFPRSDKQGGAWMTEYRAQSNIEGAMKRPHISICCNFSPPTTSQPSLLTFSEANTFLHEFGHALHGMLANTEYPSLSGTNVYRDFVELPSQIMENWLTEMEWLQQYATHYKTAKPIPKELVNKLIESRNFQAGYQSIRQLSFGILDMEWHTIKERFDDDIVNFELNKTSGTRLMPNVEGSCISTSFGHIFGGGYAAGYYSYKWAEVLDADAFSLFKQKGIFNKELASRFRSELLEKGGTVDPNELYENFRGQAPTIDALLERNGLRKK